MADIPDTLRSWSATAGSNSPTGSTSIGAGLDDNLRALQAAIRGYIAGAASNMASAATVDLSTATSNYVNVTGTTTITALGTESAGISYLLKFAGALTLTHNATSLILPGGASIVTAAGDMAEVVSEGSGNWRCKWYSRASGTSVQGFRFNVKDYGAVGDGTTDDSAAFTATFAALRTAVNAAAGGSHSVFIPAGKYRINTSINATLINPGTSGPKVLVSGYGADIVGYCTGKPIFDAIGSAHISWEGLYVEGISGSEPSCAFMIGRYSNGVSAANNRFVDVKTWGYFTRCALHNIASEQNQYLHCQFGIRGVEVAGSYALQEAAISSVDAGADTLTYSGSDVWANGTRVFISSTSALPAPLTAITPYYVVNADTGANTIQLSLTAGGAAINLVDAGSGTIAINAGNTQYGAIFDGINYFGAASDYQSMSGLTQYTAQSFLNNSVINCTFRGGQSGDRGGGLLLMAVDSWRAQDSYVVGRGGWPGTVIGVHGGDNSNGVALDIHSETSDSADLSHCVYFKDMDSTASQITCEEFLLTEVSAHAQTAIIGTNLASSTILLNNSSINVGGLQSGAPDLLPLFDSPSRYRVSGDITWTNGGSFQGTALDRFTGEIYAKISNSTVTVSNSGGDALFTYSGSDWWIDDNKVQLITTGVMPTGFTAGTVYYVVSANAGANTFKLSATSGGAAIAYTDAGTGTHTVRIDFQHPSSPSAYTLRDMSDNTIKYYGDHVMVESLYIPAGAMVARTTNGAALNTTELSTNKIMLNTLDFDPTTQEYAQFRVSMPKSWDGKSVTFKPYWSHSATTTNFGVAWSLACRGFGDSDAMDAAMGTAVVVTDTGGTTDDLFIGAQSDNVIPAGSVADEEELVFEISRVTGNAADNMAVDARLHGVLIKYTVDKMSDE